jgi:hypothetical protein
MKNGLADLNDYLFMQIERLDDENLTGDELKLELERVDKIVSVANAVISNGQLILKACSAAENMTNYDSKSMKLLTGENDNATVDKSRNKLCKK